MPTVPRHQHGCLCNLKCTPCSNICTQIVIICAGLICVTLKSTSVTWARAASHYLDTAPNCPDVYSGMQSACSCAYKHSMRTTAFWASATLYPAKLMLWVYSTAPVVIWRSIQQAKGTTCPDCKFAKAYNIYILSSLPCTCDAMPATFACFTWNTIICCIGHCLNTEQNRKQSWKQHLPEISHIGCRDHFPLDGLEA